VAYVQTINLDGESNLKTRYAKQETMLTPPEALAGVIKCEKPNRNIYGFLATVDLDGRRAISLGTSNIMLRGCELKNTVWAIGVAVYTGSETKVMLNSSGAPSKRSRLETDMNRETAALAVILVVLCFVVALLAGIWLGKHNDQLGIIHFFRTNDYSSLQVRKYDWLGVGAQVVFTFLSGVIQFQIMIPIALFISMEMVRAGQAYSMVQDNHMFDHKSVLNKKKHHPMIAINKIAMPSMGVTTKPKTTSFLRWSRNIITNHILMLMIKVTKNNLGVISGIIHDTTNMEEETRQMLKMR
jgi:phospholipid-transporting ATPase